MSTAQILRERGFNAGRVAILIGETYPWCRDRREPTPRAHSARTLRQSPDRSTASRHSKLRCIWRAGCELE